jgi:MoxR-like ATPase
MNTARDDIDVLMEDLARVGYVPDLSIATSLHLARSLERPLLIEGKPGVGKTDLAARVAEIFETNLIRLQCYEGLDRSDSLYEWDYSRQLLWIRTHEKELSSGSLDEGIFDRKFLLERPLLKAISQCKAPVLLIDEIDRADEEFEAFLLEILSEFQVSIPEIGTVQAVQKPLVILTSNRSRTLSDALRRRCLYLWIDYPDIEKEVEIVRGKVKGLPEKMAMEICQFIQQSRNEDLEKVPGVSETLDWATALMALHVNKLDPQIVLQTMGTIIKDADDMERFRVNTVERIIQSIG